MSWGGLGFFPSRMLCLFSSEPFISYRCVLGLHGQVFIAGVYKECEKLLESSPVPDKPKPVSSRTDLS